MHAEQTQFVETLRYVLPEFFAGTSVLDIGSRNVNGTMRHLFAEPKSYVGVDREAGVGVDIVGEGQSVEFLTNFDVSISCEVFEHTPHYLDIFRNMVRLTRPGGLVIFTCAGKGRPEHGTNRVQPEDAPGSGDYYKNLSNDDFMDAVGSNFGPYTFGKNEVARDTYFCGFKRSTDYTKDNLRFESIYNIHRYSLMNNEASKAMAAAIALMNIGRTDLAIEHASKAERVCSPMMAEMHKQTVMQMRESLG